MEEINEAPASSDLPKFESFPEEKPPEDNPETVAGDEPEPDTISGVNPTTNQAPSNSSALQPNAGQPQNTGGGLQTGSGVSTGGNAGVNNLLNQGLVSDKPLSVGVAGASTDSSTAPAQTTIPQAESNLWLPFFLLFLALFFVAAYVFNKFKPKNTAPANVDAPTEITHGIDDVISPPPAAIKPKTKKSKKRKKAKKPNHH